MREEFWQERIGRVRECLDAGLNQSETADTLGITPKTVLTYIRRAGLIAPKGRNIEKIKECAARGLTRAEAASELGVSVQTVGLYSRENGIHFRHACAIVSHPRSEPMAAMYTGGRTLEEIGEVFGISRERVRQLLKKYHGIVGKDGGQHARAIARKKKAHAKRNAKFMARYGCSYDEYQAILSLSREMMANGSSFYRAPLGAFRNQERNAKLRDIEWCLTLLEWWDIWQKSGKWEQRGRGRGYMMCRFGDAGPYAVGNVYIATGIHNGAVQPNNPYRCGHPDHDKVIGEIRHKLSGRGPASKDMHRVNFGLPKGVTKSRGRFVAQASFNGRSTYLGTFKTPEEAGAAYQAAIGGMQSEARAA